MAKKKITLQIITPSKMVLDKVVDSIVLNTTEGDMGVLYDHEPVVALLSKGKLSYKLNGNKSKVIVEGGFAEVSEDRVVVLTDEAEIETGDRKSVV